MLNLTGTLLAGRYRLGEPLGRGGMADVFAAVDETLGRPVAVKLLREDAHGARFAREAQVVARLAHPNIVAVTDYRNQPGEPSFLVMERLVGASLHELVDRGPIEPRRAAKIASQVLSALAAAHDAHVVHRDVKPGNVFVCTTDAGDETAKLLDFGIARPLDHATLDALTRTGALLGTVAYMAPEQVLGQPVDARTDVYGLGATLHHALAGRPPFTGSAMDVLTAIMERPAPPIQGVPPELGAIVARAMARDRADRWSSAREMMTALGAYLDGAPVPRLARGIGATAIAIGVAAAVVLGALVAGVVVVATRHGRETQVTPPETVASPPATVASEPLPVLDLGPSASAAPVVTATAPIATTTATAIVPSRSSVHVTVTTHASMTRARTAQQIQTLFETHRSSFADCYVLEQLDRPPANDTIHGAMAVDDHGRVIRVARVDNVPRDLWAAADSGGMKFTRCLVAALRSLDFSRIDGMSSDTEVFSYNLVYTK